MKKDIHPELVDCVVSCACGATFKTKSTKKEMALEVCNECHPFFTGTTTKVKKAGKVEKFNKKYGIEDKN